MARLATFAALLADPAREAMLAALLSGEAMTAGELARVAGLGGPGASAHLARLVDGGLLAATRVGRHRYHRLASPEVAAALEGMGVLAAATGRRWPHGEAFRAVRLCYDHLAGRLAVQLHADFVARGWLLPGAEGWYSTPGGTAGFTALGVDLARARAAPRFAPDCMDWSERRPHLAGGLGRELAACCLRRGFLRRLPADATDPLGRRRLALTPEGARRLGGLVEAA